MQKIRCFANKQGQELYRKYHDEEWGVPVFDDNKLFKALVLETLQSGLSFETVLKKAEHYKKHFYNFNVQKVAKINEDELKNLLQVKELIKHEGKMRAIVTNALVFLNIVQEFGSFKNYIWQYVNFTPIVNNYKSIEQISSQTLTSQKLAKDLKQRGMKYIGAKTAYAYMQAIGMVNDHLADCFVKTKT